MAALADETRRVIEAGTLSALIAHVPFADVSGPVPAARSSGGVGDGISSETASRYSAIPVEVVV